MDVMNTTSLDDSLTSIQWLCQLESNKILEENALGTGTKPAETEAKACRLRQESSLNPYQKPHYSYATLIVLAINSSREKRMTLQEIYVWIEDNYPFYKFAKKGWKNSIRHNLSLHKFFIKEKRPSVLHGKGNYWRISPEGKENLMRDLMKQSRNNLQPPYALLPHDPNRKLRPIMPKPDNDLDPNQVRYVPFLACNLPIVFVSNPTMSSEAPAVADDVCNVEVISSSETNTAALNVSHRDPNVSRGYPNMTHEDPIVSHGNPNMSHGDPNMSHGDPNMSLTDPNMSLTDPNMSRSKSSKRKSSHATSTVVHGRPQVSNASNARKGSGNKLASVGRKSVVSPKDSKQLPTILRRKRKTQPGSPPSAESIQAPWKSTPQCTLAAINSAVPVACSPVAVACSPKRSSYDDFVNCLSELTSSPLGHNASFDFLPSAGFGSPGFSPLRSPLRFGAHTGFTPVRHNLDSGIMMTPVKGFGDLSFNWTPFKTGLTPLMQTPPRSELATPSGSQGCRKSLGLDKILEADECHVSSPTL